ncbi:hypothetical protein PB01_12455 [Psychrobacillus glaciei]|uniref:Type II secretion system protein n=1 Tax=Psychrobacillus glaciei TaxID=2283160 RepID=A0A5J6STL4_9BACI|nr:hypothetical protein [Psychrobacillus glaciei]QFF99577.1 hypothetical protein PB01_12455 [Psychrobacillus glaciei]
MKKIRNEQGYTLLLTLVLVTLVVILFSTFTVKALSQQKQVEKTDDNYEATAIAEMGVEYYRVGILNLIAFYADDTKKKLSNEEKLDDQKINEIKNKQMELLKVDINSFLNSSVNNQIEVSNFPYLTTFRKSLLKYNNVTSSWDLNVTGDIGKKSKIISTTFQLPDNLDLVKTTLISGDGKPTGIDTEKNKTLFPPFNLENTAFSKLVPRLTLPTTKYEQISPKISECPEKDTDTGNVNEEFYCYKSNLNFSNNNKLEKIINLNLYYTGSSDIGIINSNFKNLNNFFADKSINITTNANTKSNTSYFINGDFSMSEPLNSSSNSTLHSIGNITLKKAINNMTNMKIYSEKKITTLEPFPAKNLTLYANNTQLSTLNSLTNSLIEIENQAKFEGIGSSMDNSQIQINNANKSNYTNSTAYLAEFKYFNKITNNSTVKVNGNTMVTDYIDTIDGKSNFLVNGNLTNPYTNKISGGSTVKIIGNAIFPKYIDTIDGGSNLLVNGDFTTSYINKIIGKSTVMVNGNATFSNYNDTIDSGSSFLVNGDYTASYINNISEGSTLMINGEANFGAYINNINGGSTIFVGKNGNVGKLIINDGRMEVNGTLNINGGNNSEIKKGTLLVNSINLIGPAKNNKENISVSGTGKLCIRDYKSSSTLLEHVKSTASGSIIFLNKEMLDNQIEKLKGYGGGSHIQQAGNTKFNSECGMSSNSLTPLPPNIYDINNDFFTTEEDITTKIEYQ